MIRRKFFFRISVIYEINNNNNPSPGGNNNVRGKYKTVLFTCVFGDFGRKIIYRHGSARARLLRLNI